MVTCPVVPLSSYWSSATGNLAKATLLARFETQLDAVTDALDEAALARTRSGLTHGASAPRPGR